MTSRRKFLGCLSVLLHGTFFLSFPWAARAKDDAVWSIIRHVSGLFPNFGNASHIGHRYLELMPGERDATVLASVVSRNVLGSSREALVDGDLLRAEAAQTVRRDFESGNTVMIDGWVLSRTEAQICGLITLGQRRKAA